MPKTDKDKKILRKLVKKYGSKKGEQVFNSIKNKNTLKSKTRKE